MANLHDALTALPTDAGVARTARKSHRCVCSVPIHRWSVRRTCEHGWAEHSYSTEAEAQSKASRWRGERCHGQDVPTTEDITIEAVRNPAYRPDCLGDIAPGDRYWEYMGNASAYQSGDPYCAVCAVAVWADAS